MSVLQDTFFIGKWLFMGAIACVFLIGIIGMFVTPIQQAFGVDNVGAEMVTDFSGFLPRFTNWIFGILFVALPLLGLGLAFLTPINMFWWWIYTSVSILVTAAGWAVQGLWGIFNESQFFSDASSSVTIFTIVMENFALYAVLMLTIIGIGTYVKSKQTSYGGMYYG